VTAERQALREVAREFTRREVAPYLQDWEDAGEVPRELHRTAARHGLLGVSFPVDVGGGGGDLLDSIAVMEGMFEEGASSGLMAALFTSGIALQVSALHSKLKPNLGFCGLTFGIGQFRLECRLVSSLSPSLGQIRAD